MIADCELTYRELGNRTGIDYTHLFRAARGERRFTEEMIDALVEYFQLEIRSKDKPKMKQKIVRRVT